MKEHKFDFARDVDLHKHVATTVRTMIEQAEQGNLEGKELKECFIIFSRILEDFLELHDPIKKASQPLPEIN